MIVAGLAAIAAAGDVTSSAPRATNAEALSRLRFHTLIFLPAFNNKLAKAEPMGPKPITVTSLIW